MDAYLDKRLYRRSNILTSSKISCIVCGVPIKSELTWNAHILSKTHKENALKGTSSLKRLQSHVQATQSAKLAKTEATPIPITAVPEPAVQSNLSADPPSRTPEKIQKPEPPKEKEEGPKTVLPEGFFDDARRDAEARNVPYRDKLDVEMEAFQKELGSLDQESEQIQEEDNATMFASRNLLEIDKQLSMWKRIHQLELEKERSLAQKKLGSAVRKQDNATDDPVATSHPSIKKEDEGTDGETGDEGTDGSDLEELDNFRCKSGVR
ncbi:hypothetical protein AAHC03_05461 [Spirometra sp. Aus1]